MGFIYKELEITNNDEVYNNGIVMPLIILRLNQAYKVQVQSSSIQYQNSPKSLSEYREPMF